MGKKQPLVEDHVSGQGNKLLTRPAHALSSTQVIEETSANPIDGLDDAEATARLSEHGRNELGEGGGVQPLRILIGQVANAMTLVMLTTSPVSTRARADPTP
jgi:magnesium-transporting ATPase (P-type)